MGGDGYHLVLEAQIEVGQFLCPFDLEFLEIVLLQVNHPGPLVVGLGQEVEVIDLPSRKKVRPTFQLTPLSQQASPTPMRSRTSRARLA